MEMKEQEHWTNWLARKQHRTHFGRYKNHNSYEPKTNTSVLLEYENGLGEALEVFRSAQTKLFDEEASLAGFAAINALGVAIDYLKGKNIDRPGQFTMYWYADPQVTEDFQDSVEKNKELLEKLSDESPTVE
jgi:ABC-type transport system substrate-binding protein